MTNTRDLLDKLISFPSVSETSNTPIIEFIDDYLSRIGVSHRVLIPNADRSKSGLLARIGPDAPGGILLSAHSDVVPVTGQRWTKNPFQMSLDGGKYYGRGTADMKGFLASMLAAAGLAASRELKSPLMLSISYDEEVGCLGMQQMSAHIERDLGRPLACVVGEPTSMQIATGHKGKLSAQAECRGVAGHSAMAPNYLNAIHLAADAVGILRDEQKRLAFTGARDAAYEIPYSTVHAGRINGGIALNIVPDNATLDFEIRHLAAEPPEIILNRIVNAAADLERRARANHADAQIRIETVNAYPGLSTEPSSPAIALAKRLLPGAAETKVAFGTEAGFFDKLGIPTIVCGPGSMAQGHQPDEYIEAGQLELCDQFLRAVVESLAV